MSSWGEGNGMRGGNEAKVERFYLLLRLLGSRQVDSCGEMEKGWDDGEVWIGVRLLGVSRE